MSPRFSTILPVGLFVILFMISFAVDHEAEAAEERFGPGDPFAAIDGEAIYLGELNLILTERLKVRDLDAVGIDVKRATAALLVRRHLALKSLRQQGGSALDAIIERRIDAFAQEAKRVGSSLEEQAKSRLADERSLKADIRWRTAWSEYLKSQLNEVNLRRYFDRERARYAGGRWRISQVFVDIDPRDQASVSAAEQKMKQLAGELRSSKTVAAAFAQAAREYSESGSAADGGMLGWVEADGDLPASVMDAVRKTPPGAISDPIRSPLGLHLVLVHEAEGGEMAFEQLSDQSQLRRDAANALFDTLIRRQAKAKVVWFIGALKPPGDIRIIPK